MSWSSYILIALLSETVSTVVSNRKPHIVNSFSTTTKKCLKPFNAIVLHFQPRKSKSFMLINNTEKNSESDSLILNNVPLSPTSH